MADDLGVADTPNFNVWDTIDFDAAMADAAARSLGAQPAAGVPDAPEADIPVPAAPVVSDPQPVAESSADDYSKEN